MVVFARRFSTAQRSDTSGQTLFSQKRRTEEAEKKKEKSFFTFTERHGKLRGVCRSFCRGRGRHRVGWCKRSVRGRRHAHSKRRRQAAGDNTSGHATGSRTGRGGVEEHANGRWGSSTELWKGRRSCRQETTDGRGSKVATAGNAARDATYEVSRVAKRRRCGRRSSGSSVFRAAVVGEGQV